MPGDSGTIHEVPTQGGMGKRISRPLPLTEGSPCALVCVDTASGLTRAFPVTEQTRLPPLGKLVHGRDLAEQTVMGGSHAKDHSVRGWGKNVEGLQHHLP